MTIQWTDEQKTALNKIDKWVGADRASFFALTGAAGTGKSTLVREVIDRHPNCTLTAATGKAALRLSACAGASASTLHKILYWPPELGETLRFSRMRDAPSDFIVVDESSLITPSVFADLNSWAADGVRILFVGDSFQLPPVVTGDELKQFGDDYSVFSSVNGAELNTVMRSVGGVLRAATKVRETGKVCVDNDDGYTFVREGSPTERAVDDYCNDRDDHMLITWKNAARMHVNRTIRARLGHEGPLPDEGEPVLIRKNGQGHMNGEIVTCDGFGAGPVVGSLRTLWMKVAGGGRILVSVDGGNPEKGGEFFDGQMPWIDNWKAYHIALKRQALSEPLPITWGYCLTCHSAQGSEARRVTVFLERGDDVVMSRKTTTLPSGAKASFLSRWMYTAVTRSKLKTTVVVG